MSEPSLPVPALIPETESYWRACRAGRLAVNRCQSCGWYIHPPRPVCSRCRSRDVKPQDLSGKGAVASYTINHQAWMPNMKVPFIIALVELAEQKDLRLTTNLINCPIDAVRIGMPVKVTFRNLNDEVALPLFEPDPQAQRANAASGSPIRAGQDNRHRLRAGASAAPRRGDAASGAQGDNLRRRPIRRRTAAVSRRRRSDRRGRARGNRGCRAQSQRYRRHRLLSRRRCGRTGFFGSRGFGDGRRAGALGNLASRRGRRPGAVGAGVCGLPGGGGGVVPSRAGLPHGERRKRAGRRWGGKESRRARHGSRGPLPS